MANNLHDPPGGFASYTAAAPSLTAVAPRQQRQKVERTREAKRERRAGVRLALSLVISSLGFFSLLYSLNQPAGLDRSLFSAVALILLVSALAAVDPSRNTIQSC